MNIEKNQAHVRYSAQEYDHLTAHFLKRFDDPLAEAIVKEVAPRLPGAVLLDVGTGTARFLIHLAKLEALAGLRLVGTDLFPDMIDQARHAVEQEGCSRIELLVEDAHSMRLPDAFADIIISRSTIHHWSNPSQVLREIYRLLKPGGVAVITDVRRDAPEEARAEFNRMRAAAGIPEAYFDEKYTAEEVEGLCRQAGIGHRAKVHVPTGGLGALGLSLVISKPGLSQATRACG